MSNATIERRTSETKPSTSPQVTLRRKRRERDRLVHQELKLADRIAYDYRNKGVEFDDLRQVAYLALTRAADRFDESHGTRFAVYASVSINGELKRYFRDHGWSVRPPRSIQELYLKLRTVQDRATQRLSRTPTVDELADEAEVDREDVLAAMGAHAGYRSQSIDVPNDPDRPSRGFEPSVEDPGFDRVCDEIDLEKMVEPLSDRQQRILEMRFHEECTQAAIAEEIGVSQVQVSRLLSKILTTLRDEADGEDAPSPN